MHIPDPEFFGDCLNTVLQALLITLCLSVFGIALHIVVNAP
jgi:hypothetical protein